jgi:hypothetical protein
MRRKADIDTDYFEPEFQPSTKKAKRKTKKTAPIAAPMSKEETERFLGEHFDFIKSKHDAGWKPQKIANALCVEIGRPGAVDNRKISNWIYHKKKSGWIKTFPVSLANKNLRADKTHQAKGCMYPRRDVSVPSRMFLSY